MTLENIRHCSFTARLDCRYLVHAPETVDDGAMLVAALHGFSATPEAMLRLTAAMMGPRHVIAAIQGPNQFYLGMGSNEVGYGWATHKHPDSSVRLHHDMLLHVLNEAGREYGIPASRRILAGFSQPVGMNYRFAATHPAADLLRFKSFILYVELDPELASTPQLFTETVTRFRAMKPFLDFMTAPTAAKRAKIDPRDLFV